MNFDREKDDYPGEIVIINSQWSFGASNQTKPLTVIRCLIRGVLGLALHGFATFILTWILSSFWMGIKPVFSW